MNSKKKGNRGVSRSTMWKRQHREKSKEYYIKNKDKVLFSNKRWAQSLNGRLISYKKSARQRQLAFSLSEKEFKMFWKQPCTYCESPIETIGLDRIINSKGYEFANVVSCCKTCNLMKNKMSAKDFISHIEKIYVKQQA